jgi:hypothetical protein
MQGEDVTVQGLTKDSVSKDRAPRIGPVTSGGQRQLQRIRAGIA